MRIIVAGIIGRYPFGGVTWCSLMYMLGLRDLGHDVYYLEDTGECIYDYENNTLSLDSSYGLNYINASLERYGLDDRWMFVDYQGEYSGKTREQSREICSEADVFINLSGGSWFWRDEYASIPVKIFIDSDPGFTQAAIAKNERWYVDFFRGFDSLFTFGRNIGSPDCSIPETPFEWKKTWQPVTTQEWRGNGGPVRDVFTTVMTWKNESFLDADGNKDKQFAEFIDLPSRTPQAIELAVNGPRKLLADHGWQTVDGMSISRSPYLYRDYIWHSKAEFSVAKHLYVSTLSGWFSDRTECYLASGRPALVQRTGFEKYLPTGEGLVTFGTLDEAAAGIESINGDYERHSRSAREIAREHFDASRVLAQLLSEAGV